jgi:XTP/dITP diphosphohydrolase
VPIVVATHNVHKLAEIRALLAPLSAPMVGLAEVGVGDDPEETGATFEENALLKAEHAHRLTGLAAIADDSGLEVRALGGRPGVHSRRFTPEGTPEANNHALLAALDGAVDRRARFRCVVAVVAGGERFTVEGQCTGTIALAPRGTHGFGYDPLFLPDETPGRTMAELTPDEKNAISHRGRAMRRLAERWGALRPG